MVDIEAINKQLNRDSTLVSVYTEFEEELKVIRKKIDVILEDVSMLRMNAETSKQNSIMLINGGPDKSAKGKVNFKKPPGKEERMIKSQNNTRDPNKHMALEQIFNFNRKMEKLLNPNYLYEQPLKVVNPAEEAKASLSILNEIAKNDKAVAKIGPKGDIIVDMNNGTKEVSVKELISKKISYKEIHEKLSIKSACSNCANSISFKDLLLLPCECMLCKSCAVKTVKEGTIFPKNVGKGSCTALECPKHQKPLDLKGLRGFMTVEVKKGSVDALKCVLKQCKDLHLLCS